METFVADARGQKDILWVPEENNVEMTLAAAKERLARNHKNMLDQFIQAGEAINEKIVKPYIPKFEDLMKDGCEEEIVKACVNNIANGGFPKIVVAVGT
eukprot:9866810-Lingulodinium_polyedra.AAC.1